MDYVWFLFSFKGRINRARYLVVQLALLTFWLILWLKFSFHFASQWEALHWVVAITMIWINAATTVKRLHDRNKSGWWIVPFIVAPGLYGHFGDLLGTSYAALFPGLASFIAFIWGFVELCFVKGTRGPNRFGSDPLPKTQTRSRSRQTGLRTSSAWDQHSELEFVPHRAGPSAGA